MEALVSISGDKTQTDSLRVAAKFGKQHKHILEQVRNMTAENPAVLLMFSESVYLNEQNKEQPMFTMNRDGFSLLVMGFTGKKALGFKLDFIEAFNTMERHLNVTQTPAELSRIEILRMAMDSEEGRIKAMEEVKILQEVNSNLQFQTEIQEKELKVSAPKVEYFDKVLDSINTYATTQIAKELGMSAIALNQKLKERGVQYQVNGQWVLTHKFQDKGYVKTKTFSYTTSAGNNGSSIQTVWTEKGRKYIHEIMNTQLNIYENNDQARLPVRSL